MGPEFRRWKIWRKAILSATGCGVLALFSGCARNPGPVHLVPADRVREVVIHALETAKESVDVEMYELGDPGVVEKLANAAARGVRVRVIVDRTEPHSQEAAKALQGTGVEILTADVDGGIDHAKILITDGGCLIGSVNWGPGSWSNHDFDLWIADPRHPVCEESGAHLERDREAGVTHRSEAGAWTFSGESARALLLTLLSGARTSVHVEMFDLGDERVLQALADAAGRGVAVHILLDPRQPDRVAAQTRLAAAGADVHLYRSHGERLHAKAAVIDARMVVLGSANWTTRAFEVNHEWLVALDAPHLARELIADWRAQSGRIR
ncbi:MAG: phospholipase D-like domain-containing protein [Kyrpidia sp.]|nr:phospholipase D-like domain-containing protein [Kyrpidia sp.]